MKSIRLLCWNVNGLRAVYKKGLVDWIRSESPDVLCLQETKLSEDQVPAELASLEGYGSYYCSATQKGYSGVALLTREQPQRVTPCLGIDRFDDEGRVLVAEYRDFVLYDVYFPNGKASAERLRFKLDFYDALLEIVSGVSRSGRPVIICGDVNTAHAEIDLARPRENARVSGFLPEERASIDRLLASGFVDTFRLVSQEPGQYSWWDLKTGARQRNIGWRIDYFFVSDSLRDCVKSAFILPEVMGSDHCPIGLELLLPD